MIQLEHFKEDSVTIRDMRHASNLEVGGVRAHMIKL